MTREHFMKHLTRLRESFGGLKDFSDHKAALIWQAVKDGPEHWFEACVNDFIGNRRQAPLLKDFIADLEDFKKREAEDARTRGGGGFGEVLGKAAARSIARGDGIPELIRARVKLVCDFNGGRGMSRAQFDQGLAMINQASIEMGGGGEKPDKPIHRTGRDFAAGKEDE